MNRARSALAIAIRFAQALGMHLTNLTPHMEESETIHGIYVWAALVSTERVLSVMLGRPCMVNEQDCSAPVPLPVNKKDHQSSGTATRPGTQNTAPSKMQSASRSSSGLSATLSKRTIYEMEGPSMSMRFFYHYLELNRLSQKVVAELYNPYVRQMKWVCFIWRMSSLFLLQSRNCLKIRFSVRHTLKLHVFLHNEKKGTDFKIIYRLRFNARLKSMTKSYHNGT